MMGINRPDHAILVPAAHALGGIGVIRSLGRAGYRVHATASAHDALGLKSRFASAAVVHPPVGSAEFSLWFEQYVRTHGIEMIVPGGGLSYGTHHVFDPYASLFPTSSDPAILEAASSKYRVFQRLGSEDCPQRGHLPPFLLIDFSRPIPTESELAALGTPLFIKLDGAHARANAPSDVQRIATPSDARDRLLQLAADYTCVLVQGYAPGRGAGAFLLRSNGRVIARMMHLRLHEMPHTGGASSLRVSWWHDAMMRDAEAKLERMGWEGVAMVEYRWDPATDDFMLMEINFRFWGSLHLALYAGVDFPRLLADAFFGYPTLQEHVGRLGIKCRNTIPGEVGYLMSLWRDPGVPLARKLRAALEACWLTLDPRIRNDLLFPGDRGLFFRQLLRGL